MKSVDPVSVVIPTLNEEKYLPVLLKSLVEIEAPLEVIVVDGGSQDQTLAVAEQAKELFKGQFSLQVIALDTKGISLQRNTGARAATSDWLLFCDADVVAPGTKHHQRIISAVTKKGCVLATGRIVPMEKSLATMLMYYLAYGIQLVLVVMGKPYFGGAYLLTAKETFFAVGGFDENLRVSEDIDYCLRAAKRGQFKLFNVPVRVSMRRYEKYGYKWLLENPQTLWRLLVKGRITPEDKIYYPFGEY